MEKVFARVRSPLEISVAAARTSQSPFPLNKPYVYLHDNQVNIIQYGIVFAWMFIKKYHENTS